MLAFHFAVLVIKALLNFVDLQDAGVNNEVDPWVEVSEGIRISHWSYNVLDGDAFDFEILVVRELFEHRFTL